MTNTASIGAELGRPLRATTLLAITATVARVAMEPEVQKAWSNALGAASTAVAPVRHALTEVAVACTVTASTWRRHRGPHASE